jgi:hypothetical protein
MPNEGRLRREALKKLYSPPVVTAQELGLDETPCTGCGHPAYRHYDGRLELGVAPGGRCHATKCSCLCLQITEEATP